MDVPFMSRPGAMKMLIGGAAAAIGGIITLATYSAATSSPEGGSYVVLYGAIGFGALNFLIGAFQFASYTLKSPEARAQDDAVLGVRLLVNAMASVSLADGEVEESELATISAIVLELTGQYMAPAAIEELTADIRKSETVISSVIDDHFARLPTGFAELIVRGCYLVAAADGAISHPESIRIDSIARALRLDPDQVADIAADLTT